jgi:hypothetical protein
MKIPRKTVSFVTSGQGKQVATRPAIPLIVEEETTSKTVETMKFKLLSVPGKKDSPTYEVTVNAFKTGTPEEYIKTLIALDQVCVGQNLKDAKEKYTMARRVFQGEALTAFNNAAAKMTSREDNSDLGAETEDHFALVLKEVGKAVFPINAYALQKQAMRRFMRKPKDMSIRYYVERMLELNKYLVYFPVKTGEPAAAPMPMDDIMDILKFGIPNTWQHRMIELGFDAQASTPSEFIELCQRISYGETSKDDGSMTKTKPSAGKEGAKLQPQSSRKTDKPSKTEANPKAAKYCPLHRTNGHDAKECKVLLAQVKRMQSAYDAGGATNAKRQKQEFQKKKTEQMFSFMVNAFKEANKNQAEENDKKRKTQSNFAFDDEVFDEFQTAVDIDDCNEDDVFDIDE